MTYNFVNHLETVHKRFNQIYKEYTPKKYMYIFVTQKSAGKL